MEWVDDELSPFKRNQTDANIIILRKTYRKSYVHPHPYRTKYICNPRQVIEAGNHEVSEFLYEGTDATVIAPTEIALLHHYRQCNGLSTYCEVTPTHCIESYVVDRSIYTYKNELIKRITGTRHKLNECSVLS